MAILNKEIKVLRSDNVIEIYQVCFSDEGRAYISIVLQDGEEETFEGDDLFDSLQLLRRRFEKNGAKVLCNGARVDVYPSGMSRSMGRARKAYVLTHGQPGKKTDLVDIFDYAVPEMIGTVDAQNSYFKKWAESLKG